jgi:hypothetical protein
MGIGVGRIYVPSAEGMASDPQQLADMSIPPIFGTQSRQPPATPSQCALDDPETNWILKNAVGTAKSHPYSAPRS